MRRLAVPVAVLLAVLLAPVDAAAKGATGLTITGDGLAAPGIEVLDRRIVSIAEWTHLYESLWEPSVRAFRGAPWQPADDLGPRLVLAWDMDHDGSAPGADVPFLQSLYPFAPGGPVVHTPDGQSVYLEAVAGGWHRADIAMIPTLRGLHAVPVSPARGPWSAR